MVACFVNVHSIMDTPHFWGDTVHGARNCNDDQNVHVFIRYLGAVFFLIVNRSKKRPKTYEAMFRLCFLMDFLFLFVPSPPPPKEEDRGKKKQKAN